MAQSVKYVGKATKRVLSAADWRKVGSQNTQTVWDRSNDFQVPVADLDEAALKYVGRDKGFALVGDPDKPKGGSK